jgi:hypothetical protein
MDPQLDLAKWALSFDDSSDGALSLVLQQSRQPQ